MEIWQVCAVVHTRYKVKSGQLWIAVLEIRDSQVEYCTRTVLTYCVRSICEVSQARTARGRRNDQVRAVETTQPPLGRLIGQRLSEVSEAIVQHHEVDDGNRHRKGGSQGRRNGLISHALRHAW